MNYNLETITNLLKQKNFNYIGERLIDITSTDLYIVILTLFMVIVVGISTGFFENPLNIQEKPSDSEDLVDETENNEQKIKVLQPKPNSVITYETPEDNLTFKLEVDTELIEQRYYYSKENLMIGVAVRDTGKPKQLMVLNHKNLSQEDKRYVNLTFKDIVSVGEIKDLGLDNSFVIQPAIVVQGTSNVLYSYTSRFDLEKQE